MTRRGRLSDSLPDFVRSRSPGGARPPLLCLLVALLLLARARPAPGGEPQLLAPTARGQVLVLRVSEGEPIQLYKDSYALVIGASDYRNGWPDLPGVREDVQDVTAALRAQGFKVATVYDPTLEDLNRVFTHFINNYGMNPQNRLLFYFAGHGNTLTTSYNEEMGYLVPVDAPVAEGDPDRFRARAMPMNQIEFYAHQIQSKHALFIFDSCFAGSIFTTMRAAPTPFIAYQVARPVRQFVTSGEARETVPDRSMFRRMFVAALEGEGDTNGDGYVTGEELGRFLQEKVVTYSKGGQHPQYGKIREPELDKGDFVFDVSRIDKPKQAAQGSGRLFLSSRPASTIRVNGKQLAEFPVADLKIRAGQHTVSFAPATGNPLERIINLRADETLRCTAFFQRGEIECRSTP